MSIDIVTIVVNRLSLLLLLSCRLCVVCMLRRCIAEDKGNLFIYLLNYLIIDLIVYLRVYFIIPHFVKILLFSFFFCHSPVSAYPSGLSTSLGVGSLPLWAHYLYFCSRLSGLVCLWLCCSLMAQ